jgi:hypothetical protein
MVSTTLELAAYPNAAGSSKNQVKAVGLLIPKSQIKTLGLVVYQ